MSERQDIWDRFFFARRDPILCDRFRVVFAAALIPYVVLLGFDLELMFGETGMLPWAASAGVRAWGVHAGWLALAPTSGVWLTLCWTAFLLNAVALLVGYWPRLQAAMVFTWLVSFQQRNPLLLNGEDTVFRLFALLLVFMPMAGGLRVFGQRSERLDELDAPGGPIEPWALRLVQLQLCLVYFGAGVYKARGHDWMDGTAFYYLARLDDLWGLWPVPTFFFESPGWSRALSWLVVLWEVALPFTLWLNQTRRLAIVSALVFHAALAWSMNLNLFQYVMTAGLIAFTEPEDWRALERGWRRLRGSS